MEIILQRIQEVLRVPEFLINQIPFLPEYFRDALITCVKFIPWLYFLYYTVELIERFFLKHIHLFIKLSRKLGPLFGAIVSLIPECGYSIIASIFYSRKMITRGTLLSFLIVCSDEALPLLFMNPAKIGVIIPIIIIKILAAIFICNLIDLIFVFEDAKIQNLNAVNTDLNERGCCNHTITTHINPPYWWSHPLTHTFNVFMFSLFSLTFINCFIQYMGNVEIAASRVLIDSPLQIVIGAIFGLIPNSIISIFIALAFVKGLISFPTLLAALIASTGLGISTLLKHNHSGKNDNSFIIFVLFITAITIGLLVHYNSFCIDFINQFSIK